MESSEKKKGKKREGLRSLPYGKKNSESKWTGSEWSQIGMITRAKAKNMHEEEDEEMSSSSDAESDASHQEELEELVRKKQLTVPDLMKIRRVNKEMAKVLAVWLDEPERATKAFHGVTSITRRQKRVHAAAIYSTTWKSDNSRANSK